MAELERLEYRSERYGNVNAYLEYSKQRSQLDEEFRDAIENYDGVVHFEKIIGVK